MEQRYRAPLILEDLARLGFPAQPPLCLAMPSLRTHAQLLGALYVMEGSTLGGQVIARQLDKAGIAKTAREEKLRAREAAKQVDPETQRMAELYRQHVLKEPAMPILQIQGLKRSASEDKAEVVQ